MKPGATILEHAGNLCACVLVLTLVAIRHGPRRVGPVIDAICFGK